DTASASGVPGRRGHGARRRRSPPAGDRWHPAAVGRLAGAVRTRPAV
ncbi:MAG: hypothetical protein AVDCRST_MAG76-3702, partial [uncultured Acidimicrobiales bacterium]